MTFTFPERDDHAAIPQRYSDKPSMETCELFCRTPPGDLFSGPSTLSWNIDMACAQEEYGLISLKLNGIGTEWILNCLLAEGAVLRLVATDLALLGYHVLL